jgi:PAS domain-containing protein
MRFLSVWCLRALRLRLRPRWLQQPLVTYVVLVLPPAIAGGSRREAPLGQQDDAPGDHDSRRLAEELQRTRAELAAARRDAAEARSRAEAAEGSAAVLADLAAAPGALWVAEASGRGVYISPGVGQLLGVAPEAVLPEAGRWLARVHPDDRNAVAGRFEALRRGEAAEVAYRVLPPDQGSDGATGRPAACWVSDLGFPIKDTGGRVRRVAGFARPAGGGAGEEGPATPAAGRVEPPGAERARGGAIGRGQHGPKCGPIRGASGRPSLGRLRAMARAHDVVAGRGWTGGRRSQGTAGGGTCPLPPRGRAGRAAGGARWSGGAARARCRPRACPRVA